MPRITAAAPQALVADANHLAMALAYGPDDGQTYLGLGWQDASGNLYAAASFEASPEWIVAAQGTLQRPAWDVGEIIDMAAAERAQAALVFSAEAVPASPAAITAISGMNGPDALISMGLTASEDGNAG